MGGIDSIAKGASDAFNKAAGAVGDIAKGDHEGARKKVEEAGRDFGGAAAKGVEEIGNAGRDFAKHAGEAPKQGADDVAKKVSGPAGGDKPGLTGIKEVDDFVDSVRPELEKHGINLPGDRRAGKGGAAEEAAPGPLAGKGKANPVPNGKVIQGPHGGTHTLGNWESDNALDIEAPEGTPIYAPSNGVISSAGGNNNDPSSRFNGYNATLDGEGNAYFLTHMSSMSVKPGDTVVAGQQIGTVGSANNVSHLHIGQRDGDPHGITA